MLLLAVMVVMNGHLAIQAWITSLNLIVRGLRVKHQCLLNFHQDHHLQVHNQNHQGPEDRELCHKVLQPKQLLQLQIRYIIFSTI